jgi:hypothetical protein
MQIAFRPLLKVLLVDDLQKPSYDKLRKIMSYAAAEGRADPNTMKAARRILERYRAAYPEMFWITKVGVVDGKDYEPPAR